MNVPGRQPRRYGCAFTEMLRCDIDADVSTLEFPSQPREFPCLVTSSGPEPRWA